MAGEVYVSAQGDTLATHVFARELEFLLHQRPFMRGLCGYKGDVSGSNSDTIKVGQIDHDDIAEAVAEGSAISGNTGITDSSYTLTPSRQAIKRTLSDKMAIVDGTGKFSELALAEYNFAAVMKRFDAMVGTACASFTGTAGTSGAAMTADDWFTAQQTLRTRRVSGPIASLLYPEQFNQLQSDLRGEVGPWQLRDDVQEAVATASGENYLGTLNKVQLWTSDQVPTANGGTDSGGAMFRVPATFGDRTVDPEAALGYAEGSPKPQRMAGGRTMAPGGVIYTDFDLDLDKADGLMVTNYFVAVAVALAGRGIKIITRR